MPSESLETIFRRDLDRLGGLADDEWVPRRRGSARRFGVGNALAVLGIVVAVVVVVLSIQAVRDSDLLKQETSASPSPYFVIASGAAAAATATPSPAATSNVAPPASDPLRGAPDCPRGSGPMLDITFPPPPGDLPGTGAATADAAFRRTYPAVVDFKWYPFGAGDLAPVWVVAGRETYVVTYIGGPGQSSWFAHPAKFVGCYTPEPPTPPPSRGPSAAPTTFG